MSLLRQKVDSEIFMSQIEDDIDDEQERLHQSVLLGVEKDGEDGFNVSIQIINEASIAQNLIVPMVV